MSIIEKGYKLLIRPAIFRLTRNDAESAHELGLWALKQLQNHDWLGNWAERHFTYRDDPVDPIMKTNAFGLNFSNPLGVAAGFDKKAEVFWCGLPRLGFGSVEIGGITASAQPGFSRPRVLRFPDLQAIWNCMGLNNPGAAAMAKAIRLHFITKPPIRFGVNIALSTGTPLDNAANDIAYTFSLLRNLAHYFTINLSCPNVPHAPSMIEPDLLLEILTKVQADNQRMRRQCHDNLKPIGVKISPDITENQLADVLNACRKTSIRYIVLVNTTTKWDGCNGFGIPKQGGLSGRILTDRAEKLTAEVYQELRNTLQPDDTPIDLVGVGGIYDTNTLYRRICRGAQVCQVYTALIYEGPDFVNRTLQGLAERLRADGHTNVSQAVGTAL